LGSWRGERREARETHEPGRKEETSAVGFITSLCPRMGLGGVTTRRTTWKKKVKGGAGQAVLCRTGESTQLGLSRGETNPVLFNLLVQRSGCSAWSLEGTKLKCGLRLEKTKNLHRSLDSVNHAEGKARAGESRFGVPSGTRTAQ